jgi:alanine racemase
MADAPPFERIAMPPLAGRNILTVDLTAVRRNIARLKAQLGPNVEVMGMVKANGYGVGADRIAKTCFECGSPLVGVSDVSEAEELRSKGVEGRIYLIHTTEDEIETAVCGGYTLGVSQLGLIDRIEEMAKRWNRQVALHLDINTGMNRLGCEPEKARKIAQRIATSPYLSLEGVMSHLSSAEDPSADGWTLEQADRFDRTVAGIHEAGILPRYRHLANSAGAIRFSFPHQNLVRVGLALYSLAASPDISARGLLEPALALTSPLVEIRECANGEAIGYNRRYQVREESLRVGVLPIGYADGLHRRYADQGVVTLHGKPAPIVGVICMDFTMVDLSRIPEARIGDRAVLFGPGGATPESFAKASGGSVYELITCLGRRIHRQFLES